MSLKEILEEEAREYSYTFYPIFKRSIQKGNEDFNEHLRSVCEFDLSFYRSLLDKFQEEILESYHVNKLDFFIDNSLEKKVLKRLKKEFISLYQSIYIENTESEINEAKEELDIAAEDEKYYTERLYIGEEDKIGGKVSEEERSLLIKNAHKSFNECTNQLEQLKEMKKSIESHV